ncbi:MAG: putative Ig domain-containing protein [Verrucomicrobiota bacterium]|jgi:hypothetical protein|nr:putative Ig domain-containing protein [Verrucomicrobiota bacterium]
MTSLIGNKINHSFLAGILLASFQTLSAQSIDMEGLINYQIITPTLINLKVAKLESNRPIGSVTSNLVLQGWASRKKYSGGKINGYKIAQVNLGRLKGRKHLNNIDVTTLLRQPPCSENGVFYITLILAEQTASDYATVDYASLGAKVFDLMPPKINPITKVIAFRDKYLNFKVTILADARYPVIFSATNLPSGLSMNSTTGVVSGVPRVLGKHNTTIIATSIAGSDRSSLSFNISEEPKIPVVTNSNSYSIKKGETYTMKISATNDPHWYESSGLPPGLNLNPEIGLISGKPNKIGTYQVILEAYNKEGGGQKSVSFAIQTPLKIIANPTSTSVKEGGNAEFLVRTEGSSQPNFRWYHNGVLLIGANKPKLMIKKAMQSDAGDYYVAVSSYKQTVVSSIVQLNVKALDNLPDSTRQRTSSTN